jgi:hypothetical protein
MARQSLSAGAIIFVAVLSHASLSAADWDDLVISVSPASPTDEQTFDLRALKGFHDSGYLRIDQSIEVNGNQIDVRALVQDQHTIPGMFFLQVITPVGAFFDDFGPLAAGTYTVNAEIWYTFWPYTSYDYLLEEGSMEFTVAGLDPSQQVDGDYDGNSIVDAGDYLVWRKTLNETSGPLPADGNGNGQVDPDDYSVWMSQFGMTSGGGSNVSSSPSRVPEPSAILLAGVIAFWHAIRRSGASCR